MEPLGGSGCGDARGDPTPVVFRGKFWCLSDEDDDGSMEGSPKSKSPVGYRRLSPEDRVSPSARYVKRMQYRALQRQAALVLLSSPVPSVVSPSLRQPVSPVLRSLSPQGSDLKLPVLEPTVFHLDSFNAQEWVMVVRKKNVRQARRALLPFVHGRECRRSSQRAHRRSPFKSRSGSGGFQNRGPQRHLRETHGPKFILQKPGLSSKGLRPVHLVRGLPAPISRTSRLLSSLSSPVAARVITMAGREQLPCAGGPPVTLRQPIPPRSTPGRSDAGRSEGTGLGSGGGSGVPVVQGEQHMNPMHSSRFETGGSSSQGGREGEGRRDDGFANQGFGGFDEGFYEGNNGFGNGFGAMNRGNYRPRPYNNYRQNWNRGYNNNFRGGNTNRFNGGENRYQWRFNNNVNPPPNLNTQVLDATNVVATTSGGTDALLAPHIVEASPVENVTTHKSKDCPLHAMPKPVAITYGVSRNALMFHEVPASSEVTFKHDNGKLGKISVSGGSLSAEDIVKELEWLIPCNHQWDLRPTDDGAFKVLFPSKADLARMTKIINVPVPGTSMFLQFEEWSATDVDRFYLTPVWVRVHGVCYKERCDYLSLFGVGSLIGKTKEVDMAFTRTHSMARMLVEVTRVEHIPTTTVDHTYEGEGYGLIFKVEGEQKNKSDVHMQDVNPSEDPKDGEGKDNEDSSADPKDGPIKLAPKAQPIQPKTNNAPTKQVHHVSLPVVRVGKIDCYDVACSKSESKAL
ncbi:hypothetical protein ACQ4PT_072068 [Festuca glaucescens]